MWTALIHSSGNAYRKQTILVLSRILTMEWDKNVTTQLAFLKTSADSVSVSLLCVCYAVACLAE